MRTRVRILLLALASLTTTAVVQAQQFPSVEPLVPFPNDARVVHGDADFEKVVRFNRNTQIRKLGSRVAHLRLAGGYVCSGFLVDADILMTNEHCVSLDGDTIQPSELAVYMEYYDEGAPGPRSAVGKEFLMIDETLDFALVRLNRNLGDEYGVLQLDEDFDQGSGDVKVIQHPAGRSKEVSRKNSRVMNIYPGKNVVHYKADTEGGSSGSPVFSLDGERVIALHHAGNSAAGYNEGMLMPAIVAKIKASNSNADAPSSRWEYMLELAAAGVPIDVQADASRYFIDQPMKLSIDVPRGGYLHVINVSEQDEMTLLYPNKYERNSYVGPGRLSLPTLSMPFELRASAPTGKQLILALLTDEPLNLYDESSVAGKAVFASMSGRSIGSMSRFTARTGEFWAGSVVTRIAN